MRNFCLPVLQVFKLGSRSITRYPHTPIADGTGILVIFFDLTTSNLKAFTMIPKDRLV